MSADADNIIIQKIKQGNQNELGKVYTRYKEDFCRWAIKQFQLTDNESQEIYQLTMLIFYENILQDKLEEINTSIKSYIFQIGKYKIYDKNRKKSYAISPIDSFLLNLPQESGIEEKQLKEKQILKINEGMQILGEPCSIILEMFYYLNKSMEEIAATFNYKNTATAKNQKYKCLKRLIKLVQETEVA